MAEFELNLRDYLRVLKRRKGIIIFMTLLVAVSAYYQSGLKKPVYKSTATIKIEEQKNIASILTDMVNWTPGNPIETSAETIKTLIVGKRAGIKMGLIKEKPLTEETTSGESVGIDTSLMAGETSSEEAERIAREISGSVATEVIPNTDMIKVSVTGSDPKRTKEVAEAVIQAFADFTFFQEIKHTQQMREFIERELKRSEENLAISRRALKNFTENYGVPVSTTLSAAGAGDSFSTRTPDPALQVLQSKSAEKKMELTFLKSRYTDKYPQVIKVQREIARIESELADAFKHFSATEEEWARLSLNVKVDEDLYVLLTKKLTEARILESEKSKSVEVVNPPNLPGQPLTAKRNANTLLGGLIGFILGLVVAFVREAVDTSFGTVEDIEEFLKLPVLGVIPTIRLKSEQMKSPRKILRKQRAGKADPSARLITEFPAGSPVCEAYNILGMNISLAGEGKKGGILLFTSTTYEEGKSIVASNCAISMVKEGKKVLLLDADCRRPSLHKIFKIEKENGLSELVLGTISKKEAVKGLQDILLGGLEQSKVLGSHAFETLQIITAGRAVHNLTTLFSSERLAVLLREFAEEYDVVIIDTPPVLAVADPVVLATKADRVVIVYQAGRIPRIALKRVKSQLENAKAHLIGVVLNNIRASEMEPRYEYYYYQESPTEESNDARP